MVFGSCSDMRGLPCLGVFVGAGIEPPPGIREEDGKRRGIVEVVVNGLPKTGVGRCGRRSDGSDWG